tara:strand:+ start:13988 stop:14518 length:531 start_codon:yes stop_codon:yes gene_type:complete
MIFIGIGSNLPSKFGNRIQNINFAISFLEEKGIKIIKKSSFYETSSQPNTSDPKFLNVVISVETTFSPPDLMSILLSIEKKLGRKRKKKNDPRTCDLDIIDFNGYIKNFTFDNFELILPHPGLSNRNFVLYPLKEISSNWSHPQTKKNIDDLISKINTLNNQITKLSENDINAHVK